MFFEEEKPALLQQIDAEFEKVHLTKLCINLLQVYFILTNSDMQACYKTRHDYNFLSQVKDEKPPAPTLGLSPKGADDEEGGEDGEDGGGGGEDAAAPTVNLADLVPRNDIR